jgi:hypothetical protein
MDESRERLTFLERELDPAFERREIVVASGASRAYDGAEWRDALVVIERGEIELENTVGDRQRFGSGDVLCLAGSSLRLLRNRREETTVLVAVSRRHLPTD